MLLTYFFGKSVINCLTHLKQFEAILSLTRSLFCSDYKEYLAIRNKNPLKNSDQNGIPTCILVDILLTLLLLLSNPDKYTSSTKNTSDKQQ